MLELCPYESAEWEERGAEIIREMLEELRTEFDLQETGGIEEDTEN
jgi:hypothetical protein